MIKLAIIADDLSSATDCGAQMIRSGLSVVVPLNNCFLPEQAEAAEVISINTDSRSLPTDQAYDKVKDATQQLVDQDWMNFYKSVDSTLRGSLGAEIEAVLDVVKPDCAIIAPAFPKYGRTTVDGVQHLYGNPLHETEFGTDPTAPVKDADIIRRLAESSQRKAGKLSLEPVRAGAEKLESAVRDLLSGGIELVIVDIREQDDLKQLCLGLANSHLRIVWVGSTGMAEFVPLAFGAPVTSAEGRHGSSLDPRPSLALVGSASETTREQLRYAEANHELKIIQVEAGRLIQNGRAATDELEQAASNLRNVLGAGHDAALVVNASRDDIAATQALGDSLNLSQTQVAQKIVDGLAQIASQFITNGQISGIVATGGDTANALCQALDAQALQILGEVEAGIPIMRLLGKQSLALVTKAGGFGGTAAMAEALTKVKQYAELG
jgi:uncharacterized protein YgbK (DUF1537 family)